MGGSIMGDVQIEQGYGMDFDDEYESDDDPRNGVPLTEPNPINLGECVVIVICAIIFTALFGLWAVIIFWGLVIVNPLAGLIVLGAALVILGLAKLLQKNQDKLRKILG